MVILLFQGALANCIGVSQYLVNWVGFWHPVVRGQVHHATRHHLDWRWTQRRATRQSYPTLSMWVLDIIIMVLVGVTWNIVFHLLTRITGGGMWARFDVFFNFCHCKSVSVFHFDYYQQKIVPSRTEREKQEKTVRCLMVSSTLDMANHQVFFILTVTNKSYHLGVGE